MQVARNHKESNDRSSESGDDPLSITIVIIDLEEIAPARDLVPFRRRKGFEDDCNEETSAHIAAIKAELAETKRRLAQLAGEDTVEAAASGSSDLVIPKDKADQFFEWLSGEVSAEDIK